MSTYPFSKKGFISKPHLFEIIYRYLIPGSENKANEWGITTLHSRYKYEFIVRFWRRSLIFYSLLYRCRHLIFVCCVWCSKFIGCPSYMQLFPIWQQMLFLTRINTISIHSRLILVFTLFIVKYSTIIFTLLMFSLILYFVLVKFISRHFFA